MLAALRQMSPAARRPQLRAGIPVRNEIDPLRVDMSVLLTLLFSAADA
jgi:hypothetical protein